MVCLAFSGNTVARNHSNSMDEKAVSLVAEVKRWRDAEKVASEKAKKAEERSSKADEARKKAKEQATRAEEARKKAKSEFSSARFEHS